MALPPVRLAANLEAYAEALVKSGQSLDEECRDVKRRWYALAEVLNAAWVDSMSPAWEHTAQFFEDYRSRTEHLRQVLEAGAEELRRFDRPS